MSAKEQLRKELRKTRKSLKNKEQHSKDIATRLLNLKEIKNASVVFCYVSTSHEVDTYEMIASFWKAQKTVCVPKTELGSNHMDAMEITAFEELSAGEYGILEPKSKNIIKKSGIDVVIIPALCYDKHGYRVGYGKGFYDRYLADYQGIKIGLCFDECIADTVFSQQHDIKADIVVTQKRVIICDE